MENSMPKISVAMITLNEEENLPFALRSVSAWADEIIVVDMYSEDKTVDIAKQFGAKVYFHDRVPAFDIAKKLAVQKTSNEYVLILDADEIASKPLALNLLYIAEKQLADVVFVPRINYIFGEMMHHTAYGPNEDSQLRFFKKNKVDICSTLHAYINPVKEAKILYLTYENNNDIALIHFQYAEIDAYMEKFLRYNTVEAKQFMENNRYDETLMIKSSLREFYNRYIEREGFKDGWRGFFVAMGLAFSKIFIFIKMEEMKGNLGKDININKYHAIADTYIERYGNGIKDDYNLFEPEIIKQFDIQYYILKNSALFNEAYYSDTYQDVKRSGIDPVLHYLLFGATEGRNPNSFFNTKYYIENYSDINGSGLNPLVHYILYGKHQNRRISEK